MLIKASGLDYTVKQYVSFEWVVCIDTPNLNIVINEWLNRFYHILI